MPHYAELSKTPIWDSFESQQLLKLLRVWLDSRREGAMVPYRSDLDPVALGRAGLMPDLWLVESDDKGGFFYRLAGENINQVFGQSLRGKHISEVYTDEALAEVLGRWGEMLANSFGFHTRGTVIAAREVHGERLVLPLCDDNGAVRYLIGATDYELGGSYSYERAQRVAQRWAQSAYFRVQDVSLNDPPFSELSGE